jgi:hypothetical protein
MDSSPVKEGDWKAELQEFDSMGHRLINIIGMREYKISGALDYHRCSL